MDNFKIIYKILKILEKAMDAEEFDNQLISYETLGISKIRWSKIMKMMIDNGYIEGVRNIEYDGATSPIIKMINPTITLLGLEYLEENSLMKKAADLAKGISNII
ncbi:MAG: YjcQ family protein [Clostridium sp.]|uniref:YjcQ family protein n=1 Tax=Clostridium TaxID=1485 RepID=UPI002A8A8C6F|nr:YjcQ family protein [Clostridium sp.]MDY5098622.1 YjcQ family protein [Clostridium sp.]